MMKLLNKIKTSLIAIGITVMALPSRIFAANRTPDDVIKELQNGYDAQQTETLYGIPSVEPVTGKYNIVRFIAIPIVVLIGLITYYKVSKSSRKKKIIVTVVIIAIIAILYVVADCAIKYMF